MEITVLVGLMALLTVAAVYFWLLRNKGQESEAR